MEVVLGLTDLPHICIVCLKTAPEMRSIDCASFLLGLLGSVIPDSQFTHYPQQVCITCFRRATRFMEFRKTCEESLNVIKALLEQHSPTEVEGPVVYEIKEVYAGNNEAEDSNSSAMDYEEEIIIQEEQVEKEENPERETEDSKAESNEEHIPKSFKLFEINCPLCTETLSNYQSLNEHVSEKHWKENCRNCIHCPGLGPLKTEPEFLRHIYSHVVYKFLCPKCSTKFKCRASLIAHMRLTHKTDDYKKYRQCNICNFTTTSHRSTVDHIIAEHLESNAVSCFMCNETFTSVHLLAAHIYGHTYGKRVDHMCEICAKVFKCGESLSKHISKHVGNQTLYTCETCGKSYKGELSLARHSVRHTSERSHKCEECGKMYYLAVELQSHMKTHLKSNRTYICEYCDRGFFNNSVKMEHVRSQHTGERRYPCPDCGKSYFRRRDMEEHQRSHTGVKPFSCDECGKVYQRKTTLMTHKKTHRLN